MIYTWFLERFESCQGECIYKGRARGVRQGCLPLWDGGETACYQVDSKMSEVNPKV